MHPTCGSLLGWSSNATLSTLIVPLFPGGLVPAEAPPLIPNTTATVTNPNAMLTQERLLMAELPPRGAIELSRRALESSYPAGI